MKRTLLRLVGLSLLIGSIQSDVIGQDLRKSDLLAYASTMFGPDNSTDFSPSKPDAVNIRVIRNFKKEFSNVQNETWGLMKNGCYIVRFTRAGMKFRVEYNQRGHWLATTKFYGAQQLPENIHQQVMSTYYDYRIFSVAEINLGNRNAYVITLEDQTSWLKVRLMNDKMEEVESYRKG